MSETVNINRTFETKNKIQVAFGITSLNTATKLRNNARIKDSTKLQAYINAMRDADNEKPALVADYDRLCHALSRSPGQEALDLSDIELLDKASGALAMNTNQVLNYLKYTPSLPEWAVDDVAFKKMIPESVLSPPLLDIKKFGFDVHSQTFIRPKIRYIATTSAHEARNYLLAAKKEGKGLDLTERGVVLGGHSRMFKLLGSQERLGNAETQIMMLFYAKQVRSELELGCAQDTPYAEGRTKCGIDLVGMQAIRYLLKDHKVFPYTSSSGRMYVNDTEKDFACTLPQIIITLLNIATMELTGVYNHEFALLATEYMFDKARESLCQGFLEQSSKLRDLEGYLYAYISDCHTVIRERDGVPVGVDRLVDFKDWEADEQMVGHRKVIKDLRGIDLRVWTYITKHSVGIGWQKSLRLRWLKMLINGVTSPAIFNKTSLLLEYEKSAAPVQKVTVPYPSIAQSMIDVDGYESAISWNWQELPSLVKTVHRVFKDRYHRRIMEKLKTLDFEREFAEAMTNRSEGVKLIDPTLPQRLQNISNTRVISLALTPEDMNIYSRCIDKLRQGGACTIRFQIRRRARVVVMVIKQKQAEQIVNLRGFEALKEYCKTIDVGQQKGDIRNCALQLYGSSGTHGVNNSSDFKGQDAHTMPVMSDFISSLYADTVFNNDSERYYCMNSGEELLSDKPGAPPKPQRVAAIFKYCRMVTGEGQPIKYVLKDECFLLGKPFLVNSFTFHSGLFGTTAQHTTIFSIEHEGRVIEFNAIPSEHGKIISDGASVGDDFYELIVGTDAAVKAYIKFSNDRFAEVNFEIEAKVSRIFATFLQNDCLLGMYVPKPDRMSVWCEEKNEVRSRERLDIVRNITSLGRIYSQRTYSNDNIRGLIMSSWNLLRRINYSVDKGSFGTVGRLVSRKHSRKWLTLDKDVGQLQILLPYITVCLPPLSFPLPPLHYNGNTINGTSMTSPNGDINWLLIRQLFDTDPTYDLRANMLQSDNPQRLDQILKRPTKYLDYSGLFEFGVEFGVYFIRFRRNALLNARRDEEITQLYKQRLVSFYRQYQDQGRAYASVEAYLALQERKIKVSTRLAYFMRPEKKIDDALVAREQNLTERDYLDTALFVYLSKFKGKLPFDVIRLMDSFAFRLCEDSSEPLGFSEDFKCTGTLPTLPSYHASDDFGKLFRRVGGVARYSQFDYKEYQAVLASLDGIGGADIVISESRRILSKFKDKSHGVSLLMDFFAIPRGLHNTFRRVVMDDARMYFYTPYQSYTERQAFMDIDTSTFNTEAQLSVTTFLSTLSMKKAKQFTRVVQTHIRDLINASISTYSTNPINKVLFQWKPFSYAMWVQFTRVDPQFARRILEML